MGTLFPMDEQAPLRAPDGTEYTAHRDLEERLWLGSAGWSYDDWDGVFYPSDLSKADRLSWYARHFRSVEIDSTFYGRPAMTTVQSWYRRTPEDFMFSAKFPRRITHEARLVNCEDETYRFVEVMTELGEKMGPLLLQFPPSFASDRFGDLERFLTGLPDGLMYAVEIRHRSWLTDEFADLLEHWNVALCLSCGGHLDRFWRVTSRIAYIRWLGQHDAVERFDHVQIDRREEIEWWAPRIRHFIDRGGLVFGYVNNHYAGYSPATIHRIASKV